MIRLPITAKVALWSFLVAAFVMGGALVGVTLLLQNELVSTMDESAGRVAADAFKFLDKRTAGADGEFPPLSREALPPSIGGRCTEIFGPDGALLYRSANLAGQPMPGGDEPREFIIRKQPVRSLTFRQKGYTLRIGTFMTSTKRMIGRVKDASLLAVPVGALLSLVGGYWVASRAMRPIRKLTEAAQSITAEDLHRRLPVPHARDEIQRLTNVLNKTLDRLERSYLQAKRFASDASHQLKTPVTVLRAAIEELLHDPSLREEHAAILNDLLDQTRRLTSLSDGLLLLAQADAGRIETRPRATDLVPIIRRCVEDAEILAADRGIRIKADLPEHLLAVADPGRTEQVLLNLLENAVKYNRLHGSIRVETQRRKDSVSIVVANTGRPIPGERIPWIFERFARAETDESRAGHGLGLAIARELAVAQGGDVLLVRSDYDWTEFELRLAPPEAMKPDGHITPLLTPPPRPALLRNAG
jgi:signal transduction histidine kinase